VIQIGPIAGPVRSRAAAGCRHRRPRLVATVSLVGFLTGLWLLGGFPLVGSGEPPAAASSHPIRYVVRPGDTLWWIVSSRYPNCDPRPLVDTLERELGGGSLRPGEVIELP